MDSDMLLKKRFDEFIPEHGFATFNECWGTVLLQAAFLIGEQGNSFAKKSLVIISSVIFIARWFFRHVDLSQIMVMVAEKEDIKGKILNNI